MEVFGFRPADRDEGPRRVSSPLGPNHNDRDDEDNEDE